MAAELDDIAKSIATINDELGKVWRQIAAIQTEISWIKWVLRKLIVPLMVSMFLVVLGVLIKLLMP